MTKVAEFVRDTLGMIGVVDPRQTVQAADEATTIRFLNRLMTRIEANGTSFGWSDVSNPSDTLPLPPEAELGVMYVLAIIMAAQFSIPTPPEVVAGAQRFEADLLRDQAVATPIQQVGIVNGKTLNGPWVG